MASLKQPSNKQRVIRWIERITDLKDVDCNSLFEVTKLSNSLTYDAFPLTPKSSIRRILAELVSQGFLIRVEGGYRESNQSILLRLQRIHHDFTQVKGSQLDLFAECESPEGGFEPFGPEFASGRQIGFSRQKDEGGKHWRYIFVIGTPVSDYVIEDYDRPNEPKPKDYLAITRTENGYHVHKRAGSKYSNRADSRYNTASHERGWFTEKLYYSNGGHPRVLRSKNSDYASILASDYEKAISLIDSLVPFGIDTERGLTERQKQRFLDEFK